MNASFERRECSTLLFLLNPDRFCTAPFSFSANLVVHQNNFNISEPTKKRDLLALTSSWPLKPDETLHHKPEPVTPAKPILHDLAFSRQQELREKDVAAVDGHLDLMLAYCGHAVGPLNFGSMAKW